MPQQAIFDARAEIDKVFVSDARRDLHRRADRRDAPAGRLRRASSRSGSRSAPARAASLALDRCSRVHAWLDGRDHRHARGRAGRGARLPAPPADPELRGSAEGVAADEVDRRDRRQVAVRMRYAMSDAAPIDPGVYVALEDLLAAASTRAAGLQLPAAPAGAQPAGRPACLAPARPRPQFRGAAPLLEGDDTRTIDWQATARLASPHVRVFTEERDRPVLLVVDQRLSMFFGSRRAMKSVVAAEAAVIGRGERSRSGIASAASSSTTRDIQEMRPQRSRRIVLQFLSDVSRKTRHSASARDIKRDPAMLNRALDRVRRLATHDDRRHLQRLRRGGRRARGRPSPRSRHKTYCSIGARPVAERIAGDGPHDSHRRRTADGGRHRARQYEAEHPEMSSDTAARNVFAWTHELDSGVAA